MSERRGDVDNAAPAMQGGVDPKPLRTWFAALPPRLVGACASILVMMILSAASYYFLIRDRDDVLATANAELIAISTAGAGFAERAIGTLDIVVSLAADEFRQGTMNVDRLVERLRGQAVRADQLESLNQIAVIDRNGRITYARDPRNVGVDVSDRRYFTVHRDLATSGIFIDRPLISRTLPTRRIVPISWPLRTRQGDFAGVIGVVASWKLYSEVFSGLLTRPDQVVALVDSTGRIYAMDSRHWPDPEQEPVAPVFVASFADPVSLIANQPIVDDTLVARADVMGLGLQVVTGTSISTVLRAWWIRTYVVLVAIVAMGVGAGILAGLLHRYVQELRGTAREAVAAQARAEAGDRAKAQFLAAMSHEIRTPMTGVLGMADLLSAESLQPRQQSYVQAIRTSGRHLLSVINDVLDFSRLDAGGLVLEKHDFSLAQVVEQLRSILVPSAIERGLSLEFEVDPTLADVVCGDSTRLRQVLVNLVGNGLKFTSQGGVLIRILRKSETDGLVWCRFEVQDSGIGIPSERQAELFQAFTQADLSTTRKYGGSGLGLAICRQLVQAMGGVIGVISETGRGSVFWFEVPFEKSSGWITVETMKPEQVASRPMRILIAEDVDINRDLLLASLGREGHDLVMVENGEQAVAQAQQQPFDVVLMDVQMPVMDGIEATRRIRMLPAPAGQVPILALTANVMESERQRCLHAGMNQVLTKPIVWPDLFAALHAVSQGKVATVSPKPTLDPDACELLDEARIASLGKMAGSAKLAEFLTNAITSAEDLTDQIRAEASGSAAVATLAHRLAGTAPSFGLARIGSIARDLEQQCLADQDYLPLVQHLGNAVVATRQELARLRMLSPG